MLKVNCIKTSKLTTSKHYRSCRRGLLQRHTIQKNFKKYVWLLAETVAWRNQSDVQWQGALHLHGPMIKKDLSAMHSQIRWMAKSMCMLDRSRMWSQCWTNCVGYCGTLTNLWGMQSSIFLCLSPVFQARINWDGCGRKGIRCKIGGIDGGGLRISPDGVAPTRIFSVSASCYPA